MKNPLDRKITLYARTYPVSPIEKMGEKKKKMELFLIFVVVDDFNKAHMSSKIYAGEVHQSTS